MAFVYILLNPSRELERRKHVNYPVVPTGHIIYNQILI